MFFLLNLCYAHVHLFWINYETAIHALVISRPDYVNSPIYLSWHSIHGAFFAQPVIPVFFLFTLTFCAQATETT